MPITLNQEANKQCRYLEDKKISLHAKIVLCDDFLTAQLPGTFYYSCNKNTVLAVAKMSIFLKCVACGSFGRYWFGMLGKMCGYAFFPKVHFQYLQYA